MTLAKIVKPHWTITGTHGIASFEPLGRKRKAATYRTYKAESIDDLCQRKADREAEAQTPGTEAETCHLWKALMTLSSGTSVWRMTVAT